MVPLSSESTAASTRPAISPVVSTTIDVVVVAHAHARRRDLEGNLVEHIRVEVRAVTSQDRLAKTDPLEVGEVDGEGESAVSERNLAVGRNGRQFHLLGGVVVEFFGECTIAERLGVAHSASRLSAQVVEFGGKSHARFQPKRVNFEDRSGSGAKIVDAVRSVEKTREGVDRIVEGRPSEFDAVGVVELDRDRSRSDCLLGGGGFHGREAERGDLVGHVLGAAASKCRSGLAAERGRSGVAHRDVHDNWRRSFQVLLEVWEDNLGWRDDGRAACEWTRREITRPR